LKAIGTLNDKNGLTIRIGKVKDGAAAQTTFGEAMFGGSMQPLLAKSVDDNVVANLTITFKSSSEMTVENLAHEGSHAEDHQKFVAAMMANPGLDDEAVKQLPENLTKYATESKAYHATSYVKEYQRREGELWKRGWKEADRQIAIDGYIKNEYKVTPKDPGRRLYETEKKD